MKRQWHIPSGYLPQDNVMVSTDASRLYTLFAPHYDMVSVIIEDAGFTAGGLVYESCQEIISGDLDRISGLHRLHLSVCTEADIPRELAGRYRNMSIVWWEWDFAHHDDISGEMFALCSESYDSVGAIIRLLVESLGRIHPYANANRRTLSLYSNCMLIQQGFFPIPWSNSRIIWEQWVDDFVILGTERLGRVWWRVCEFYHQQIISVDQTNSQS